LAHLLGLRVVLFPAFWFSVGWANYNLADVALVGSMSAPPVDQLVQLVSDLVNVQTRENALLELSKKRESFPDLAPYLWHSFGTMAALLQEIISIYPSLSPPSLTAHASNRVCNALALLQCVASHQDTRALFLQGTSTCHTTGENDDVLPLSKVVRRQCTKEGSCGTRWGRQVEVVGTMCWRNGKDGLSCLSWGYFSLNHTMPWDCQKLIRQGPQPYQASPRC
jgi:hypothetical protein